MTQRISRRQFNFKASLVLPGTTLLATGITVSDLQGSEQQGSEQQGSEQQGIASQQETGAPSDASSESSASNQRLIELGLNALARAPELNYFADGHRGAAMISAHLMCEDNGFQQPARQRIVDLFDANWAQTKLCQPFPDGDIVEDASERVGKTLAEGGGVLREVGHDVIFAMHAIKGFGLRPELATEARVSGVCQLIKSFKPWRDVAPDADVDPPAFVDSAAAAEYVLNEAFASISRFRGYGQGFAGHMLTFGQSLIELASLGYEEWAESCRTAFCKYVTVTRRGPQPGDRLIKDHQFSKLRPDDTEYWKRRPDKSLGIGHVFKYPYAYYDLVKRANAPELEQRFEEIAWELF